MYNLNNKNLFFVPNLTEGEGQVFGIGCKVFTIAGPVILYGFPLPKEHFETTYALAHGKYPVILPLLSY